MMLPLVRLAPPPIPRIVRAGPLLVAAACGADVGPRGAPMDRRPGATTVSPSGRVTVEVREGGDLWIGGVHVDAEVDPRLALAPDESLVVYARAGLLGETDLWRVSLAGADVPGPPLQLTDWRGSEDRPAFSPDGTRLAFVSGRTGVASWYAATLPTPGVLLSLEQATQLTNVSVGPRRPGFAPTGYTAPPDGTDYTWTADGLSWREHGVTHTVTP